VTKSQACAPCREELYIDGRLLAGEQAIHGGGHGLHVNLSDGGGEEIDDALVGDGDDALTVDLDDAMADADAAALRYPAAQQAADLEQEIIIFPTQLLSSVAVSRIPKDFFSAQGQNQTF